ncbi:MAG: hypothetical protein A4E52_00573 [Pelotomaculum sp. PtaB.Bin013]|uniref:Uncharacterized protein n=1 Tax=Pelotomaculum isophthalicicum JI TaxID=947010 RepID=A0A9X4JUN4_9FIRM|nr:hypothetical protein [Pelotomaculum isophthalicicum]MDF9409565.1 hypothetical protein [Pelotomaculum isophthalicicum JI]OPX91212.1 MAG: hypothetical protein A4E52_00573 [Pelotomaculum sp. PtaB.Bin013]
MRKIVSLVIALVLSTTLSSAAFASQSGDRAHYSDSKISFSNYGDHFYNWYHNKAVLYAQKYSDYYVIRIAQLEKILHKYNYGYSRSRWDYDRDSERYFYVDANGVSHYFYLDPDKDYTVHQYKDNHGTIQYWFEDAGWK